ncbi:MAG: alpha/beta fold hydrolase [Dehalococcoidia bacterium]
MTTAIAERYVTLSHGKTRYFEAGTGEPLIVLHGVGYTSAGDSWSANMGPLATRFRVLAPDFLGWGLGDRLGIEYSFAYLVDFVRELQDALGIARSHIVGHSMGGWIASLLAYESPNRVDRLVLVASGGLRTRTLQSMTEFAPPDRDAIRRQLEPRVSNAVELDALVERDFAKTQVHGALDAYRRVLRHMNEPENRSRYNTGRRLPFVMAPTLVLWGRDDAVNDVSMAEETARLVPNAELVILDGIGHGVPAEAPEQFNKIVGDFLSQR